MNLIAEIGINHNGDIIIAKRLIDIAILSGFDYVKFQKRNPDICVPEDQKNKIRSTIWGDITYLEYKHRLEFDRHDYIEIDDYIKKRNNELGTNLKWFASVWDIDSAEFMINFSNIVKIPSALITDEELLLYCRSNFKTVIISTGMSTEKEIDKAVEIGEPDIMMHTNSCYPSPIDDLNLNYIKWLKNKFKIRIGYSGHEWGLSTTYAAAGIGIDWLERHVTLDHNMWGSDQKSSIDPVGCFKFVRTIKDIEKSMGKYGPRNILESEIDKRKSLSKNQLHAVK